MITPQDLFELDEFAHKSLFDVEYVWEALKNIKEAMEAYVEALLGDGLPVV